MLFHFSQTVFIFHRNINSVAVLPDKTDPHIKKPLNWRGLKQVMPVNNSTKTSVTDVSACFMAFLMNVSSTTFRSPLVLWNQTSFDLLKKSFALSGEWMTNIIKGLNQLTFFVQPLCILWCKGQFFPLRYSGSRSENKRNSCCDKI